MFLKKKKFQLYQEGIVDQAIRLFEKVLKLRAEEPQSLRDLALAASEKRDYQRAVDLLWKMISTEWPVRFQHIEDEATFELNRYSSIFFFHFKEIHFCSFLLQNHFLGKEAQDSSGHIQD